MHITCQAIQVRNIRQQGTISIQLLCIMTLLAWQQGQLQDRAGPPMDLHAASPALITGSRPAREIAIISLRPGRCGMPSHSGGHFVYSFIRTLAASFYPLATGHTATPAPLRMQLVNWLSAPYSLQPWQQIPVGLSSVQLVP